MAFFHVLVLSLLLFAFSMFVGHLPLFFSFKQSHLRYLTTYGLGLLIGTAFIVIIPEGVHTLYSSPVLSPHSHSSLNSFPSPLQWEYWRPIFVSPDIPLPSSSPVLHSHGHSHDHGRSLLQSPDDNDIDQRPPPRPSVEIPSPPHFPLPPCSVDPEGSGYIGAALAFGFVFTLLIDRFTSPPSPDSLKSRAPPSRRPSGSFLSPSADGKAKGEDDDLVQRTHLMYIPINRDSITGPFPSNLPPRGGEREREVFPQKERVRQRVEREKQRQRAYGYQPYAPSHPSVLPLPSLSTLSHSSFSQSATLGILVHAAVDGLTLGTIGLSSPDPSIQVLAFLSLLLNKIPIALGLVSFLIYQGRHPLEIRTHLSIFSLTTPLVGLITYIVIGTTEEGGGLSASKLGLGLLFSGGAFLFTIAVHIMPELTKQGGGGYSHGMGGGGKGEGEEEGEEEGGEGEEGEGLVHAGSGHSHGVGEGEWGEDAQPLEWKFVLCLIAGILSPFICAWRHPHAHGG